MEPLGLGWTISAESFRGAMRDWLSGCGESQGAGSTIIESVDNSNLRRDPPLRGAVLYRACATSDSS